VDDCPFCRRVAAGQIEISWPGCVAFPPRRPLVPGHVLVLPRRHITDAAVDPEVTALVMRCAAEVAQRWRRESGADCNLITSVGAAATQSVPHLHVHVLRRREGDGLLLPWSPVAAGGTLDGMVDG
jgi:histidine triad (HIT) family protein